MNGIKTLREKRARLISQLAGAVDEAERAEINDRVEALDGAIVREQKKLSSTQKAIELVLAHMAKLRNTKLIDVDKAVKRCATRWLEKVRAFFCWKVSWYLLWGSKGDQLFFFLPPFLYFCRPANAGSNARWKGRADIEREAERKLCSVKPSFMGNRMINMREKGHSTKA